MLFDVGRASGTKLCRLIWNTNLVEIELQGWLGHSKNGQTRKWVWSSCNVCNQLLMGANY